MYFMLTIILSTYNFMSININYFLEVFLNYITLIFMLVGFTSMFASFSLKQATLKVRYNIIFNIFVTPLYL